MAEYSIYNLPKLIFFCCFGTLSVVLLLVKSDKLVDIKAKVFLVSFARKIIFLTVGFTLYFDVHLQIVFCRKRQMSVN